MVVHEAADVCVEMISSFNEFVSAQISEATFGMQYRKLVERALLDGRFSRAINFLNMQNDVERLSANLVQRSMAALLTKSDIYQSAILMLESPAEVITIPAAHSAMCILNADASIDIDVFNVKNPPDPYDLPESISLEYAHTESLCQGETIILKPSHYAYRLKAIDGAVTVHRMDALRANPYVVSFAPDTLSLKRVTYSNLRHTSNNFFIKLACALALEQARSQPSRSSNAIRPLIFAAFTENIDIASRWEALQCLSQCAPDHAVAALQYMASSGLTYAAERAAAIVRDLSCDNRSGMS